MNCHYHVTVVTILMLMPEMLRFPLLFSDSTSEGSIVALVTNWFSYVYRRTVRPR